MTEKKKIYEIVEHLIGIDRGLSDHIMSIELLIKKLDRLNKNNFLINNKGRIRISEEPYGNWDDISLVVEFLREETDEEVQERLNSENAEELYEKNLYLKLKEKYDP